MLLGLSIYANENLACNSAGFLCTVTAFNGHRDITIDNQIMDSQQDKQKYSNISNDVCAIFLCLVTNPSFWFLWFDIYILKNYMYPTF